MTDVTARPARRPWFYRIPLIGRIAREVIEGDSDNIWYLAVIIATLWILAIMQWGLPAIALPALLLTPLCLLALVLLTLD
jgi:hypothetical protein